MPLMDNMLCSVLATNMNTMFLQSQETINIEYIAKQAKLFFTQDGWMAPDCVALMAITAQCIDNEIVMRDLNLIH
ncbi:uncharacterized protein VP01_308g8 [Puccinia sorghi]|uniref:Uncharacterized protein n=1 Tax=Puccinia sorghi TaxID=27349 RepID=A0A0L6V0E7_9BASI|nr:uncharacterized protein VP01_308g8 [Puccinia sorghi]